MCRFSDSLRPPAQPVDGLEALLDDTDDFNWFDAIDELPEDEEDLIDASLPAALQQQLPATALESDCSTGSEAPQVKAETSSGKSGSDTSSYDLLELFKQQIEQPGPAAASLAVQSSQFVGAAFTAVPSQQLVCNLPATYAAGVIPPQLLATPLAATPAFLPAAALAGAVPIPAVLNNAGVVPMQTEAPSQTLAMDMSGAAPSTNTAPCVKSRRSQKTPAEIDAAVQRIKQKRRESAQRSRARKNDYMRQLELENQALKDELQRLQQIMAAVQRNTFQQHAMGGLVQLGAV